jgi:hypothetical protein
MRKVVDLSKKEESKVAATPQSPVVDLGQIMQQEESKSKNNKFQPKKQVNEQQNHR